MNTMKKLSSCIAALIISWSFILTACSDQITPINIDADGIALKGYDPVAYFTLERPVKGLKSFQYEWNNAIWLFASSEHMKLFQEDPDQYAPQYGGY
jgi:YHS domain-containing protein